MIRVLWAHVRWAAAVARWCAESVGYWVRPYDMLADARRWRWQPAQRCWRYARGGVIKGPSDPGDDSITYMLSDGHGWVPAATVELYGEEFLRRLTGVDHIHPLRDDCREMPTRRCPPSYGPAGCGERPCARFESDDETPWLAAERRERSEPPK